jgi:predicted DNA-binding transcriptional regulator YafY
MIKFEMMIDERRAKILDSVLERDSNGCCIFEDLPSLQSKILRRRGRLIAQAMRDPDNQVIDMVYVDSKGNRTERIVSPIRWEGGGSMFMALCLGREEPRLFKTMNCSGVLLKPAHEVQMPEPIEEKKDA